MDDAQYKRMIGSRSAVVRQPKNNTLSRMLGQKPRKQSLNACRKSKIITLPKLKCLEDGQ